MRCTEKPIVPGEFIALIESFFRFATLEIAAVAKRPRKDKSLSLRGRPPRRTDEAVSCAKNC